MPRVLIVEDSMTQAEILWSVLQGSGFEADLAPDGDAALALLPRQTYDIIISDIIMPGMSGYDLCRKIKAGPYRDIPVILLTSLSDPMDIIGALECEADSFITKPYQPTRLIERVQFLLHNRDVRRNSSVHFGVELVFLGKKFVINSDRRQILDLLISTFEDTVRTNAGLQQTQNDLAAAKLSLEQHARELEERVNARTWELERQTRQLNAALDASRKSEARFRSLVANIAMPILVCDRAGTKILDVNEAAVREYGYSHEEFLGMNSATMLADGRPDAPDQLIGDMIDGHRTQRRHKKKNGEIIDVEVTGTALEYEGQPAFLAIINDITERLKTEAQLRHNERLDAIGSLTGGVAHDFNNLLTVIKASAEDFLLDLQDPDQRQTAQLMLEAANRGADLVRHLLAFDRKQELAPTQLDVNGLIDQVVKLARRTLPSNIAVKVAKSGGLPLVNIDPARLESAVLNLAVNARDAMPDGGELVIETALTELDEFYAKDNAEVVPGWYVQVAISDTGTGMPQEVIDHAFEPFFTTKGVGKGTGLGLSMVYGLMKQSGGHAKIYSVMGKGTTIKLYLPTQEERMDVPAPTEAPKQAENSEGGGNLLLVEDDELVRKSLIAKLKRMGYAVTAVESAAAAIATLEKGGDFKLMLSDVMMPGNMTGADLAREVLSRWPNVGVLLNSGYTESSIGGKVKIPDGVRLLSKPYSTADLADALRATLERRPQ
jgi:PAS domain S-box-containing protein